MFSVIFDSAISTSDNTVEQSYVIQRGEVCIIFIFSVSPGYHQCIV